MTLKPAKLHKAAAEIARKNAFHHSMIAFEIMMTIAEAWDGQSAPFLFCAAGVVCHLIIQLIA